MPTRRAAPIVLSLLLVAASGCAAVPPGGLVRPGDLPAEPVVQLRYADLPSVYGPFAVHSWLSYWDPAEGRWHRWDGWKTIGCGEDDFGYVRRDLFDDSTEFRYSDHSSLSWVGAQWRGAEARRLIETLRTEAPRWDHKDTYIPWPGPNCNTFIADMIRLSGVKGADMHPRAIGKDYVGPAGFGVGFTPSGTGVQLETPFAGILIGLAEGLEVHVLCFTFGIDLWPPALKTPLGRLGFPELDQSAEPTEPPNPPSPAEVPRLHLSLLDPHTADASSR